MNRRPLFKLPFQAVAVMALVCVALAGLVEFSAWWIQGYGLAASDLVRLARLFQDPVTGAWVVAAAVYGLRRLLPFHPTVARGYADWLAGTPWRPGRPLPLGPPHLVWEDAAPAALPVALCLRPVVPVLVFAGLYALLTVSVTIGGRDRRWVAAACGFALGGGLLAWPNE